MQLFWQGKKKPYHTWLISYVTFVLLFTLFAFVMTMVAKSIVQEEITKANREAFSTMNTTCHTLKNDLDKLGIRVSLDKEIIAALQNNDANQALNQQSLRKAISTISANNQNVDHIFIYDIAQEMMVDYDGANRMQSAYQEFLPEGVLPENADYAAWKVFMRQPHVQRLCKNQNGDVMYLQSIPMEGAEKTGVLVCQISTGQIERMFPDIDWNEERELLLLGVDDTVVYQSQPQLLTEESVEELIQKGEGSHTLNQGGKKIVAFVSENGANLTSIYALSAGLYWSGLNFFLIIMTLLAVLFTVLGILLANIFARRQYTPVENILKLISGNTFSGAPRTNEFDYIQTTLRGILKSAKESELLKKKYQNISFRNAYIKFLREDGGSVEDVFGQYNVVFDYPVYVAALLSINDFSDYFGTIDFENENEQELMELAITNVFDEMLGDEYHTLSVRIDENMLLCLIGMQQENSEDLHSRIGEAQGFTKERVGIYYSVLLSESFSDLQQLQRAYAQTIDLFAWRHAMDQDILAYQDVDWSESRYEFTVELEQQLLESIRRGAEGEAEGLLRQIFHQHGDRPSSAQELKFMKYDMMSAFLKLLRSDMLEDEGLEEQEIGALENCLTMQELYSKAKTLAEKLCRIPKKERPAKETTLGDKVMQYVQENYADMNLNVNELGGVFKLSSSYLSKTFKQQTGEILRDYILNVRLKNAESLLHSDLKLEEIAHRCGFIDAGTFIRAFKKRYGTTPGKYREQF